MERKPAKGDRKTGEVAVAGRLPAKTCQLTNRNHMRPRVGDELACHSEVQTGSFSARGRCGDWAGIDHAPLSGEILRTYRRVGLARKAGQTGVTLNVSGGSQQRS